MAPGVENRQHAFGVFMDTFNAMRNYFLEHYEKGIGMFIPSLGAFSLITSTTLEQTAQPESPASYFFHIFSPDRGCSVPKIRTQTRSISTWVASLKQRVRCIV